MSENVVIRKYQPGDLDACRGLWRELTERHRQLYDDPTIGGDHPEDYFNSYSEAVGANRIWIAEVDGKVVGFTGLKRNEEEAEIEPIIVSASYRRRGIGTKLVQMVVAEAQKLGVKSLSIIPVARNLEAIRLFYRLGFRNLGQIELFMDFADRKWRKDITLFNHQLGY